MIQWFGKENGYSDAEIRSMVWRITSVQTKRKKEILKSAGEPVKGRKKLKKAA